MGLRPAFGWIILRCVRHNRTASLDDAPALYWRESARRVRYWYPSDPILIVDNRSNRTVYPFYDACPATFAPCSIVSYDEHVGAEILPYVVMAWHQPFERAIFLFDTVFPLPTELGSMPFYREKMSRARVNLGMVRGVRALWDFHGPRGDDESFYNLTEPLTNASSRWIIRRRFSNGLDQTWLGVFGAMAVFELSFAEMLVHDLGFDRLLPVLTSAARYSAQTGVAYRMAFERLVGVLVSFGGNLPTATNRAHFEKNEPRIPAGRPGYMRTQVRRALQGSLSGSQSWRGTARCGRVLRNEVRITEYNVSWIDVFLLKCWMPGHRA